MKNFQKLKVFRKQLSGSYRGEDIKKDSAIVIFRILKKKYSVDLEVPLNISANELVGALNKTFDLKIDTSDIKKCYLKAENPIRLLRGNKTLREYGVRNGTVIIFTE